MTRRGRNLTIALVAAAVVGGTGAAALASNQGVATWGTKSAQLDAESDAGVGQAGSFTDAAEAAESGNVKVGSVDAGSVTTQADTVDAQQGGDRAEQGSFTGADGSEDGSAGMLSSD